MKVFIRLSIVLITLFSFSNLYAQVRHRAHRNNRPAKAVVVKSSKKIKKGKWQKLGAKTVNLKLDSDQMLVTAYEGAFTKIKFKTSKAAVHINSLKIVFAKGESKHININRNFSPGTESKLIDLPGNKRIIQKIKFNYRTINTGNGKAKVTVWGKH